MRTELHIIQTFLYAGSCLFFDIPEQIYSSITTPVLLKKTQFRWVENEKHWWSNMQKHFCFWFGYISILALTNLLLQRWCKNTTDPQIYSMTSINQAVFVTAILPIRCRIKANIVWNNSSWALLHLNEWCQACLRWWQVFIYCFTDNILHRVTLEVKISWQNSVLTCRRQRGKMNILLSSTHCKQLSNI